MRAELVREEEAVGQNVCEFFLDPFDNGLARPLEALQQLGGLDADALRKVLRRVELSPVAFVGERPERLDDAIWLHRHALCE